MSSQEELIRRAVAANFSNICMWARNKTPTNLGRVLPFIPKYTLVLWRDKNVFEAVDLFPIVITRKGKKRVYTSSITCDSPKDVYMFYLSVKELQYLVKRSPDMPNYIAEKLIDLIGDRWVVTHWAYSFKNVYALLKHLVMFESDDTKSNNPVVGDTNTNWKKWTTFASDFCRSNRPITSYRFMTGVLSHFMEKCP